MKLCDLHTHSKCSDGADTPSQIIELALEIGLSAVALCDHDNVDGLPEFLAAAEGKDVLAIAGAEFSVDYKGKEIHLLGLFIPESEFENLSDMIADDVRLKEKSNIDLIDSLKRAGYDVDFEAIKSSTEHGKFNRVAIANALIDKGYVSSVSEAMDTLLSEEWGHYHPRKKKTVFEMIDIIKSIGAVPILAHPLATKGFTEADLSELLPLAKERGLVGMECYYSEYDDERTEKALAIADEFGLKYSGGSDYHGNNKPHIQLGAGCGNLKIPYEWMEELKPV